ncbi:MAG: hypothetical protein GY861_09315 [bacterium]|nr:hypothetical protein [bacterium]
MKLNYLFTLVFITFLIIGCQTENPLVDDSDERSDVLKSIIEDLKLCKDMSNSLNRQGCVSDQGHKYGKNVVDFTQCNDLEFDYSLSLAKESCLYTAAFYLNDSEICEHLKMERSNSGVIASGGKSPDVSKESCKRRLLLQILDENDPEYCELQQFDKSPGRYYGCISELAPRIKDCTLCEKINVSKKPLLQNAKDKCVSDCAIVTDDLELCNSVWGEYEKRDCASSIARQTSNIEVCDILGEKSKISCVNSYYRALAKKNSDPGICEKITYEDSMADCKRYVEG